MLKRNSYDDEIPFTCETCGEEFTIEGFYDGYGEGARIVPADGDRVLCPNDYDYTISFRPMKQTIPSHDVSYTGGAL